MVSRATFHGPLDPGEAVNLMEIHQELLCLDSEFIRAKAAARYASLIHLQHVVRIHPTAVDKRDRRAWVVLSPLPPTPAELLTIDY
jgi:hypothetical protein